MKMWAKSQFLVGGTTFKCAFRYRLKPPAHRNSLSTPCVWINHLVGWNSPSAAKPKPPSTNVWPISWDIRGLTGVTTRSLRSTRPQGEKIMLSNAIARGSFMLCHFLGLAQKSRSPRFWISRKNRFKAYQPTSQSSQEGLRPEDFQTCNQDISRPHSLYVLIKGHHRK